jgi:diketogulonate reductase-like aldo/keto reductase
VNRRPFGRTGESWSEIGIGTYYGPAYVLAAKGAGLRIRAERKLRAYATALDAGVNWIDTAEIYGTEPLVGEALRDRRRDEVFVATKVWPNHLRPTALRRALEGSLRRLGTRYVDLYQIHFPSRRVPIRDTVRALERWVEAGLVRHIGVSNFSLAQLREADAAMARYEIVSDQVEYNLLGREIESDLLPALLREGRAVLAYRPLARGRLASPGGPLRRTADGLAARREGRTFAQIALNWVAGRGPTVFPIVRASRADHVREAMGAADWRLDPGDVARLDSVTGGAAPAPRPVPT